MLPGDTARGGEEAARRGGGRRRRLLLRRGGAGGGGGEEGVPRAGGGPLQQPAQRGGIRQGRRRRRHRARRRARLRGRHEDADPRRLGLRQDRRRLLQDLRLRLRHRFLIRRIASLAVKDIEVAVVVLSRFLDPEKVASITEYCDEHVYISEEGPYPTSDCVIHLVDQGDALHC